MDSTTGTSTAAIAQEVVSLCRAGRNMDAINKFYSPDVVSMESMSSPEMPAEQRGIEAIKAKNRWWMENTEVHSSRVAGPFLGDDDQFAVHYDYDTTFKPSGQRMRMTEMALYKVKDGRIVHEHFFYSTQPS